MRGPFVAAVGPFDTERLGDLLRVRILEHELKNRLPGTVVVPYVLAAEARPIALDGGYSALGLGSPVPKGVGTSFDCVVVLGPDLGPEAADRIRGTLPAALYQGRMELDPLVLSSRLFRPDVLRKRIDFLRQLGAFPERGRPLVVQGGRVLDGFVELVAAEISRAGPHAEEVVLLTAEPADGDREISQALASRLPGRVRIVPECAGLADLVAVLSYAGCFVGSSRDAALVEASFGVPAILIRPDPGVVPDATLDDPGSGVTVAPLGAGLAEAVASRMGSGPSTTTRWVLESRLEAQFDALAALVEESEAPRRNLLSREELLEALLEVRRGWGASNQEREASERRERDLLGRVSDLEAVAAERDDLRTRLENSEATLAATGSELSWMRESKLFRYSAPFRRIYGVFLRR